MSDWRPVPGYIGLYEVSDEGQVRRVSSKRGVAAGRLMRPGSLPAGYQLLPLRDHCGCRRSHLVHRLVMAAFVGPCPDGHEVNHKDLNKRNNWVTNLEYVTRLANVRHAWDHGASGAGDKSPNHKLTAETVREVRRMLAAGATQSAVASHYGVSRATIRFVMTRRNWSSVD